MPLILSQHFSPADRVYADAEGSLYHYPQVYFRRVQPYELLIYYRPLGEATPRSDSKTYFGHGVIGVPWPDPDRADHRFAPIIRYEPFPKLVGLKDPHGNYYETGTKHAPQGQSAVRVIDQIAYHRILAAAGVESASLQERAREDHQATLKLFVSRAHAANGACWYNNNIDLFVEAAGQRLLVEAKSLSDPRQAVDRMRYGIGQLTDYGIRYRPETEGAISVLAFGCPPDRETSWVATVLEAARMGFVAVVNNELMPLNKLAREIEILRC